MLAIRLDNNLTRRRKAKYESELEIEIILKAHVKNFFVLSICALNIKLKPYSATNMVQIESTKIEDFDIMQRISA